MIIFVGLLLHIQLNSSIQLLQARNFIIKALYKYILINIMKNSSPEPIDLAIIVQKQSQTGMFRNQRLLLIKSGFISYFSNIPKFYIGNVRSIELSGELPKMTLSAAQVESIERKRKYIHMKFNKKYLINLEKFKGLVQGGNDKIKDGKVADELQEWIFKCQNINEAETFLKQIQYYKNDPSRKPQISKAVDGYKDGKKGFRPDSIRLPSSMTSVPNRYSEQPTINNKISRTNAISFDEKKIQIKQNNFKKNFEHPILQIPAEEEEQEDQQRQQIKVSKEQVKQCKKNQEKNDISQKLIQENNEAPFILPVKSESVSNSYSKQTFPYYPFVKPKKSSKKQELKQIFLKDKGLSGKKLLQKLSSNKVKVNPTKDQITEISKKPKTRLEKRSNTLQQFRKSPNQIRTSIKEQKTNNSLEDSKKSSSWSNLKRLKRSYSLIQDALASSNKLQQTQERQQIMKMQPQNKQLDKNSKEQLIRKEVITQQLIEKQNIDGKKKKDEKQSLQNNFEQKHVKDLDNQLEKKQVTNIQIEQHDHQSNLMKSQQSVLEIARMLQNMTKLDETNISYELGNTNLEQQEFFTPQQKQENFKYYSGKDNRNNFGDKQHKQKEKQAILNLQNQLKKDFEKIESLHKQKESNMQQKLVSESKTNVEMPKEILEIFHEQKLQKILEKQKQIIKEGVTVQICNQISHQKIKQQSLINKKQDIKNEQIIKKIIEKEQVIQKEQKIQKEQDIKKEQKNQKGQDFQKEQKFQKEQDIKKEQKNQKGQDITQEQGIINKKQDTSKIMQQDEEKKQIKANVQHVKIQHMSANTQNMQKKIDQKQQVNIIIKKAEKEAQKQMTDKIKPQIMHIDSVNTNIGKLETKKQENLFVSTKKQELKVENQQQTKLQQIEVNKENKIQLQPIKQQEVSKQSDEGANAEVLEKVESQTYLSLPREDDAISFKDLHISQERNLPQMLTPRFVQDFGQIQFKVSSKLNKVKKKPQQQINEKYFECIQKTWMLDKKRISIKKQQVRLQCKMYIEQLINQKCLNQEKKNLQKMAFGLFQQSQLKLPVSLCYQILRLKRERSIINKAAQIMKEQIDKECQCEHENNLCMNIVFGMRKRWNSWCLYVYEDEYSFLNVLECYKQLQKQLQLSSLDQSCRIPYLFKLKYKGKFGIFIQSPNQEIHNKIPDKVQKIISEKIGLNLQQCRSHVLFLESIQIDNRMIIWIDPDYLSSCKIDSTYNINRRMSWVNSMNNTINESKLQDINKLVECAWQQYLQFEAQNSFEQDQKFQIMKILLDTYHLSVQISVHDSISAYHACKIQPFQQTSSLIEQFLNFKHHSPQFQSQKLSLKSIKLLIQSQCQSQVKIIKFIQLLSDLAQLFYSKQEYEKSYQVVGYYFKLVLSQNIFKYQPFSFGRLKYSKFILIQQLCQQNQIASFYRSFLNALVLYFKIICKIIINKNKQRDHISHIYESTINVMNQLSEMAEKKILKQKIKQLLIQINYHQILIHQIYLVNSIELQEKDYMLKILQIQRKTAQSILMQCQNFNKFSHLAFKIILKVIDDKLQSHQYLEVERLSTQQIYKLESIKSISSELNDIVTQFICRRDICELIKSDSSQVGLDRMRVHLEFYLQKLTEQEQQNQPESYKNHITEIIKKIIRYICEHLAYNDFSACCSLLKILRTYNLDKETIAKLVQQGFNQLQPYIKKRVQAKQLM